MIINSLANKASKGEGGREVILGGSSRGKAIASIRGMKGIGADERIEGEPLIGGDGSRERPARASSVEAKGTLNDVIDAIGGVVIGRLQEVDSISLGREPTNVEEVQESHRRLVDCYAKSAGRNPLKTPSSWVNRIGRSRMRSASKYRGGKWYSKASRRKMRRMSREEKRNAL